MTVNIYEELTLLHERIDELRREIYVALDAKPPHERRMGENVFTLREREILDIILSGVTTRQEIAKILFVADATIRTHLSRIYEKVGVKNMTGLVLWVFHVEGKG